MSLLPPPPGLPAALNAMLLERAAGGIFVRVGDAPPWARHLWPDALRAAGTLRPRDRFPFLDHFLPTAEALWNDEADGHLTSELWTEVDATGHEWLLEAVALRLDGRALLLLKFPTVAPEQIRDILQESRELSLEHYRLIKEIDRREVALHCLVHDLSTPLAALRGSLQMLVEDEHVEGEGEVLVRLCERQIEKMKGMTAELLYGAAPEEARAARLRAASAPDLAESARELMTGLAPTATLKDVRFRLDVGPRAGARWPVVAEQARLERVLFNLFENALRHAPPGSEVVVRLAHEGEAVCARIEDAGEGVPPSERARLFRKYAQGGERPGQVGLGLYFCRITVEGWGGSIGYEPVPEGGACFWFRLPTPRPVA
ncbi:MAG: HAMP domain-containing sensor histidine kinase [Rhodothermales bacterium]|nr:HAMP domain-containing sensor histidine kinase [Rhodothermales bacterium]